MPLLFQANGISLWLVRVRAIFPNTATGSGLQLGGASPDTTDLATKIRCPLVEGDVVSRRVFEVCPHAVCGISLVFLGVSVVSFSVSPWLPCECLGGACPCLTKKHACARTRGQVILASDGVYDNVYESQIIDLIEATLGQTPEVMAQALVGYARQVHTQTYTCTAHTHAHARVRTCTYTHTRARTHARTRTPYWSCFITGQCDSS